MDTFPPIMFAFFEEVPNKLFFFKLFFSFVVVVVELYDIFDTSLLSDIRYANIFSHSVAYLFF